MSQQSLNERVTPLVVDGESYRDAFRAFLAGTDEKDVTHAYLTDVVRRLPARRTFLDVGAADGTTTKQLSPFFEKTLCIEPGEHMYELLRRNCPDAVILRDPVLEAQVRTPVDLALLSHVLYYLPRKQWTPALLRILSWVRPGGELLVALQNPANACMRMVRHFTGARFDLARLAEELAATASPLVGAARLETLPVRYHGGSLEEAVAVAEFHLSVPELGAVEALPTRQELSAYVRRHFTDPAGGFTMPHDQDMLHIRRSEAAHHQP
ncbi:class I SAM-dependent methyltransferase [Streptomyces sp. HMX112]|uniref:class I SAM-dependent methyltransferase n=1 Tax=Streptomyces sp. HMX112 TaxID=3390850 RepID=UPI003A7F9402